AGTVRHHRAVAGALGGMNRGERLGERTDLVDLDEDRVGEALLDAVAQARRIGDEEIVADELDLLADAFGAELPAGEVVFRHAVFDRYDRVARGQFGEVANLLVDR